MRFTTLALSIALPITCSAGATQQVVVRDTIESLPPLSVCQDGATHATVCTGMRLRPGPVGDLSPFVGQALEIRGTPGMITCPFLDVTSVTVLPISQLSFTTIGTPTLPMSVSFSGAAPAGTSYLVFLSSGLVDPPAALPQVTGPIHLDLAASVFVGIFNPLGTNALYHTILVPMNPSLLGVPFYDQAAALLGNGTIETTNVDCFEF